MHHDPAGMAPVLYSIAAVERDTGLSKDTLRVWERRYGFPRPARDAAGQPMAVHRVRRVVWRLPGVWNAGS